MEACTFAFYCGIFLQSTGKNHLHKKEEMQNI